MMEKNLKRPKSSENSNFDLNSEEECELKWRRWKSYLQGILHFLRQGRHSAELIEAERRVVERWSKYFFFEGGSLRQKSQVQRTPSIPITSYLDCFRRISECHVRQDPSGSVVHLDFGGTLSAATEGYIWPRAEDDVREYLKLCFQCQATTFSDDCPMPYKDDLPSCFARQGGNSMLFSGEAQDEVSPRSSTSPSPKPQTSKVVADPAVKCDPLKSEAFPYHKPSAREKSDMTNKSLKRTLARARKTLFEAARGQAKRGRPRKIKQGVDESLKKAPAPAFPAKEGEAAESEPQAGLEARVNEAKLGLEGSDSNPEKKQLLEVAPTDNQVQALERPMFQLLNDLGQSAVRGTICQGSPVETKEGGEGTLHGQETLEALGHLQVLPAICTGCGFEATSQAQIHSHLRSRKFSDKRYRCCMCPYKTKSFLKFSAHMGKKHSLSKPDPEQDKANFEAHVKECEENSEPNSNLKPWPVDKDIPTELKGGRPNKSGEVPSEPAGASAASDVQDVQKEDSLSPNEIFPRIYNHLCEICCTLLSSSASLEYHLSQLHKIDIPQFPCNKMSRVEPSAAPLRPFFPCLKCGDRFWTAEGLNIHVESLHDPAAEENAAAATTHCPACNKTQGKDTMAHMAKHHVTVCEMFLAKFCPVCQQALSCPRSFENHMLTTHGKFFPSRQSLYLAIFSHVLKGESPSLDLGKAIEALKSLSPSAISKSLLWDKTPWVVNQDDKDPPSFGEDYSHKNEPDPDLIYGNEMQCPYCDCEFSAQHGLDAHIRQFHGMSCPSCVKKFSTLGTLNRHIRSTHPDAIEQESILNQLESLATTTGSEGLQGEFEVRPSAWRPASTKPEGRIPLYVEDSLGTWVPSEVLGS